MSNYLAQWASRPARTVDARRVWHYTVSSLMHRAHPNRATSRILTWDSIGSTYLFVPTAPIAALTEIPRACSSGSSNAWLMPGWQKMFASIVPGASTNAAMDRTSLSIPTTCGIAACRPKTPTSCLRNTSSAVGRWIVCAARFHPATTRTPVDIPQRYRLTSRLRNDWTRCAQRSRRRPKRRLRNGRTPPVSL